MKTKRCVTISFLRRAADAFTTFRRILSKKKDDPYKKAWSKNGVFSTPGVIEPIEGIYSKQEHAVQAAQQLVSGFFDESVSIAGKYRCMYGDGQSFQGAKTVLLSHYDPHGLIDPYVIHLCRHFKSLGWMVVVVSGSGIRNLEPATDWIDAALHRTCPGYDFSSWKAALDCFPSILESEELVCCNDSIFGPISSIAPMHETMRGVSCDFWGITNSHGTIPRLQSHYMVFRHATLIHPAFKRFFDAIPLDQNRGISLDFEHRMAIFLSIHGLRIGVFSPLRGKTEEDCDPSLHLWRQLLDNGVPFVKKAVFLSNCPALNDCGVFPFLRKHGYPPELVFQFFSRTGKDISPFVCNGSRSNEWPSDVFVWRRDVELDPVIGKRNSGNENIGVFVHAYYPERLAELAEYLKNIPRSASLFVSTDKEEKFHGIGRMLEPLNFASLKLRAFPNQGWDIGPFLAGFADEFANFSLILKVHVKSSNHMDEQIANQWRKLIFSSLLGSEDRVQRIISYFRANPEFGLLAAPSLPFYMETGVNQAGNHNDMSRLLGCHDVDLDRNQAIDFPMASMFWCRPEVLRPWSSLGLTFNNFGDVIPEQRDGSLAHAVERLFFFGCAIEKHTWGRVFPDSCVVDKTTSRKGHEPN